MSSLISAGSVIGGGGWDWSGPGESPHCPRAVLADRAVGVAVDLVEQVVVVLDGACGAPVLDVGQQGWNVSDRDVE
jgi:hypothetical protein